MIKTAVIGATGFIGRHLLASYRRAHPDAYGTCNLRAVAGLSRLDLGDPDVQLDVQRLLDTGHEAVIVAAARSDPAACERDPEGVEAVNVRGTLRVLEQICRAGMQAIFTSSEYVFDGATGGYTDDSLPQPATLYGRQKLEVERALPGLSDNHLILRLSKVYGVERGDGTLLDNIASALAEDRRITVATDQIFCPTRVHDVVAALHAVQAKRLNGVINLCGPEVLSRLQIAEMMADTLGVRRSLIEAVRLHDIAGMAGRPLNLSMRCARLQAEVEPLHFTPLRAAISLVADQWRESVRA